MIIKITQTASNSKQAYEMDGPGFYYQGKGGSLSHRQTITMANKKSTLKGVFRLSRWTNYLPLRHLLGFCSITRQFVLYKDGVYCGRIGFARQGFLKSLHIIEPRGGATFRCYSVTRGSYDYVCVYQGTKQIALVETYLHVSDYKYVHKLYLLDEYKPYAELLSFFVLYYAGRRFARRFHMSAGGFHEVGWSLSRNGHKYDPHWRETHFPEENFFGKTGLQKPQNGDL